MNGVNDENRQIADRLRQAADLPAAQGANPFRVSAYRHTEGRVARRREPECLDHCVLVRP